MSERIDVPVSIAISTYGRAVVRGARTALLVHGAGMDQSIWTLQGRYLAFHGWNAVAVDLPGHGRARGQPALRSIREMADWLAGVIATIGAEAAAIIGHSMGALAALEVAARYPERVAQLVLLGAATRMPVHPELLEFARRRDRRAVDLICDWGFGTRGHVGGNPLPGGWLMGTARGLLLRGDPAVLATDLAACDDYRDGEQAAAAIRCPTLVLVGAEDRMTPPRAGRALAERIVGAACAEIADAGHMMMVEQPEATLAELRKFMR